MNASGDAAEQTLRLVIQETEFVIRITGSALKETIAMLYAISKDKKQNSIGQAKLANMLKNCKDTKIFTLKRQDFDKFVDHAKNYGIYYSVLLKKNERTKDGTVDIIVRADDAARVDRLVERFDLSVVDTASLRTQTVKEPNKENSEVEKSVVDQNMMDDILKKTQVNEDEVKDGVSNNFLLKENPSEHFSENKKEEVGENSILCNIKAFVTEKLNIGNNENKESPNSKRAIQSRTPNTNNEISDLIRESVRERIKEIRKEDEKENEQKSKEKSKNKKKNKTKSKNKKMKLEGKKNGRSR